MDNIFIRNPFMYGEDGQQNGLMSQPAPQQQAQMYIPQVSNPLSQINPMYTRQQSQNSLAPMQMYHNYKATGQMPQQMQDGNQAMGQLASAVGRTSANGGK